MQLTPIKAWKDTKYSNQQSRWWRADKEWHGIVPREKKKKQPFTGTWGKI